MRDGRMGRTVALSLSLSLSLPLSLSLSLSLSLRGLGEERIHSADFN